jgi:hypothetical protein
VEHGEDAGGAADPLAVGSERLPGNSGGSQERGVDQPLVGARGGAELGGEGEGEEGVVAGE